MTHIKLGDLVTVNSPRYYGVVAGMPGGQSGFDVTKFYVFYREIPHPVIPLPRDNLTVIGNAFNLIPRSLKDDPPEEGKSFIPLRPEADCPGGCLASGSARSTPDSLKYHLEMGYTHWIPKPSLPESSPEDRDESEFEAWWAGPSCVSGDSYHHTAKAAWMARARKDRE
jgi:hypothetical protein